MLRALQDSTAHDVHHGASQEVHATLHSIEAEARMRATDDGGEEEREENSPRKTMDPSSPRKDPISPRKKFGRRTSVESVELDDFEKYVRAPQALQADYVDTWQTAS